jgi:cell division protein FtsZ
MVMPGLINLDFADVRSVMHEMGKAMMGTGEAEGDGRALEAAEKAIANPLLDGVSMQGAKGVIVSITGGEDMRLMEVDEAANYIRELVDPDANIIWGSAFNENLNGKIRVSVVATGIDNEGFTPTTASQRTPFSFSRPAAEPVVEAAPAATSLFENAADTSTAEETAPAEFENEAEDDSLVLGSDFAVTDSGEAEEDTAAEYADNNMSTTDSWANADALELDTPVAEGYPAAAPVDVTEPPERSAPRIPTGGTLFERMSNLSRGLTRSEDDAEKGNEGGNGVNFPSFLDRQNNS